MKRNSKILVFILAFSLLIGSAFCFAATADEEPAKKLTVISQNVEYSDTLYLYYAVYPENVDTEGLKLEIYTSNPTGEATPVATVTESTEVTITDTDSTEYVCRAFKSPGIALKDMSAQLYVKAVAADGTESSVRRYSVVEYFNEMSFTTEDESRSAAYRDMLKAGDAAQLILNHYPNDNANDYASNYKYVTVTDGTLADGFDRGVYLTGTSVTLNYTGSDAANTGWTVENLMTGETEYVAFGSAIVLDAHVSLTPTIKPYERGEGLYWTNSSLREGNSRAYNFNGTLTDGKLNGQNSTTTAEGTYTDGAAMLKKLDSSEVYFYYSHGNYETMCTSGELGVANATCHIYEFDYKISEIVDQTSLFNLGNNDQIYVVKNSDGETYSIGTKDTSSFVANEWFNIRFEIYKGAGANGENLVKIFINNEYATTKTFATATTDNNYSRIRWYIRSYYSVDTTISVDNLIHAASTKTYVAE